jgi:hypothetical protein
LQEHKQTNTQNAINAITKQHKTNQANKQTNKQKHKKSKTVVQKDK